MFKTQAENLCSFLPSFPFSNRGKKAGKIIKGHPHGGNAQKREVSFFTIITILTIICVINAIQQLCKQAVSDAVSYLQYEDNNGDVFDFFP